MMSTAACPLGRRRDPATRGTHIVSDRRRGYVAYLLRLWQVEPEEDAPWRASVESPQTGERRGFASLAELLAFLEKEIAEAVQAQVVADRGERGGDIHT